MRIATLYVPTCLFSVNWLFRHLDHTGPRASCVLGLIKPIPIRKVLPAPTSSWRFGARTDSQDVVQKLIYECAFILDHD
jgi:hypothetical protein